MIDEIAKIDQVLHKLDEALKTVAQGRQYNVGTMVLFQGKLGIVTDLNQGSEDPAGSTVDIRMDDGEVFEKVNVASKALKRYRA